MNRLLVPYSEARYKLGGIGRTKFDELLKANKLVRVKIGRRGFVTAESLTELVASLGGDRRAGPPGPAATAAISRPAGNWDSGNGQAKHPVDLREPRP